MATNLDVAELKGVQDTRSELEEEKGPGQCGLRLWLGFWRGG